jgi:hypothetical protein
MVCEVLKLVFHVLYAPRCKVATPRHGRLGLRGRHVAPPQPLTPPEPPPPSPIKMMNPYSYTILIITPPHDMHIHVHIRSRTVDSTADCVTVDRLHSLHRRLYTLQGRDCVLCVVAECGETVARRTRHRLCRARGGPPRAGRVRRRHWRPPPAPGPAPGGRADGAGHTTHWSTDASSPVSTHTQSILKSNTAGSTLDSCVLVCPYALSGVGPEQWFCGGTPRARGSERKQKATEENPRRLGRAEVRRVPHMQHRHVDRTGSHYGSTQAHFRPSGLFLMKVLIHSDVTDFGRCQAQIDKTSERATPDR